MKTSFENLFEKVDYLLSAVDKIYVNVKGHEKQKVPPKNLSLDNAIIFLKGEGITISKSKLYKLTADKKIPFQRFNGRLLFSSLNLDTWLKTELAKQNKLQYNIKIPQKNGINRLK